jgi:hypothetical protein
MNKMEETDRHCILKTSAGDLKIERIHISSTATMNLGNYNSVKPTAGITIIPEEGQNLTDVFKAGWDFVDQQVVQQIKKWQKNSD